MYSIRKIFYENFSTFYDFRTGKKYSVFCHFAIVIILSLIMVSLFHGATDNFLLGLITAQSIFVGFAFNLLFFIANSLPEKAGLGSSIEKELIFERLSKLKTEMFYNISYFLVISIFNLILAMVLLLPEFQLIVDILLKETSIPWVLLLMCNINYIFTIILFTVFYILLLESIYTLLRIINRVVYFFEKKITVSD